MLVQVLLVGLWAEGDEEAWPLNSDGAQPLQELLGSVGVEPQGDSSRLRSHLPALEAGEPHGFEVLGERQQQQLCIVIGACCRGGWLEDGLGDRESLHDVGEVAPDEDVLGNLGFQLGEGAGQLHILDAACQWRGYVSGLFKNIMVTFMVESMTGGSVGMMVVGVAVQQYDIMHGRGSSTAVGAAVQQGRGSSTAVPGRGSSKGSSTAW